MVTRWRRAHDGAMGHGKRRWQDLTPQQRAVVVVAGTVQLALHGYAWADLIRRPAEQVNGPKPAWGAVLLISWVGPITYLTVGRKRD